MANREYLVGVRLQQSAMQRQLTIRRTRYLVHIISVPTLGPSTVEVSCRIPGIFFFHPIY